MPRQDLLDQILEVSQDYLGPAAERFIERQISTHLNKSPAKVTRKDLLKLIDWIRLSFALLTDNSKIVEEYIQRLTLVAKGEGEKAVGEKWQTS